MIVVKSKITGYCHGVDKTIHNARIVLKRAKALGLPAYSIGDLIHNEDVVRGFEKQGLVVIDSPDVKRGVALIRAHGIPEGRRRLYEEKGFILVDSTCENINKTKNAINLALKGNRKIIVVGVKDHAETNTLLGTAVDGLLVSSAKDLDMVFEKIPKGEKVGVAVQTTFSENEFAEISNILQNYFGDILFLNRLCAACTARKSNGVKLAQKCDAVFVVGGKNSSNTKELAAWIERCGKPVFAIENTKDFNDEFDSKIKVFKTVGICSGTSTPAKIINEVCKHLEEL